MLMGLSLVLAISCKKTDKTTPAPTSSFSVTTNVVTSIGNTTAIGGGTITVTSKDTILGSGICWSTSQNPTFDDDVMLNSSGSMTYSCTMSGLTSNTTYYVRAFAIKSNGYVYGSQVSFKTTSTQQNTYGSLSASVSGVSFVATTAGWTSSIMGNEIVGSVGTKEIGIFCSDFTVGPHTLTGVGGDNTALYSDVMTDPNNVYNSQSGTVTITSYNASTGEVKGTFSFVGKYITSANTIPVTNGQFDVFTIAK